MNWTNSATKGANKTPGQAIADWYFEKTKGGADLLYVDTRTPNGGGTYNPSNPEWHHCEPRNPVQPPPGGVGRSQKGTKVVAGKLDRRAPKYSRVTAAGTPEWQHMVILV